MVGRSRRSAFEGLFEPRLEHELPAQWARMRPGGSICDHKTSKSRVLAESGPQCCAIAGDGVLGLPG